MPDPEREAMVERLKELHEKFQQDAEVGQEKLRELLDDEK